MQLGSAPALSKQLVKLGGFHSNSYGAGTALTGIISAVNPLAALGSVRFRFTKRPSQKLMSKDPEGIQYHGFKYFPRFPDQFKDPQVEPTKLFMVKRIRSLYGCPWWEKEAVQKLKLGDRRAVAIVKNTPTANKHLYKIKHLIEIMPITMPHGLPDSAINAFLKENGEFVSYNPLNLHGITDIEKAEQDYNDVLQKQVDNQTLKGRLHKMWYTRYGLVN